MQGPIKRVLKVEDDGIYILVTLLTGLLIGFACLTLSSARQYSATQEYIVHTQEIISTAQAVGTLVDDMGAETSAYLLDPREDCLARLHGYRNKLSVTLQQLVRLTAGNETQHARAKQLVAVVRDRINILEGLRARRRAGDPAALPRMENDNGRIDSIRMCLAEINTASNQLLSRRLHAQANAANQVFIIMAMVAALVPLVVSVLLFLWHRNRKSRLLAEEGLRAQAVHLSNMNADLERLSADLADARDRAESASTLKSRFLANTSHEIRTPMNAILGLSTLLAKTVMSAEQHNMVRRINDSAGALLTLINDILDFSKIEAGKLDLEQVEFEPVAVVTRSCEVFAETCEKRHIQLRTHFDDSVPAVVEGDPTRIHQILVNLVGNAVKFSCNGGDIDVRLEASRSGEIATLKFSIADHGIGMSAEELKALFQPFVQADSSVTRKYGGTGLGLSICKALVELMNGTIQAESTKTVGSTFSFQIPARIADGSAIRTICHDSYEGGAGASHERPELILVAEDNTNNQFVAQMFLQQLGFKCDIVSDGAEVVNHYLAKNYDLILMDCQMPIVDGIAAARAIRRVEADTGRHVPIVAVTASAMVGDRENCLVAGMDDYMTKPLKESTLREVLNRWLPPSAVRTGQTQTLIEAEAVHKAPRASQAVIDVDELVSRYAASTSEILNMFTERTPSKIDMLREAVARQDRAEAARLAHYLKGSSSTICSSRLTDLFERIERQVEDFSWSDVEGSLSAVDECYEQIASTTARIRGVQEVNVNAFT